MTAGRPNALSMITTLGPEFRTSSIPANTLDAIPASFSSGASLRRNCSPAIVMGWESQIPIVLAGTIAYHSPGWPLTDSGGPGSEHGGNALEILSASGLKNLVN